ncbi:MAG: fumarate hydratase [Candidatus Cloacimonas sp. SDB]|nr:MAG: fumarate hydratase [Candidatus Cloacimonas sp. SDB]
MRKINVQELIPAVKKLCIEANYYIGNDIITKLQEMAAREKSATAREVLAILLKNHQLAAQNMMPLCQDTGTAVIFVELGQEIHLTGGDFTEALNEGVRQGYEAGYLRKSIVNDPVFDRINTRDNTPAIIYMEIVPGNEIRITVAPKGAGAENMSDLKMLKPADGIEGVINFVVDVVSRAGSNPCPPVIVGVGLGGNFEYSALLAKKALLRPLNQTNPIAKWAKLEADILKKINNLGIGPQGLGGRTTALGVNIQAEPCHIASLPVAVNIQCHAARCKSLVL